MTSSSTTTPLTTVDDVLALMLDHDATASELCRQMFEVVLGEQVDQSARQHAAGWLAGAMSAIADSGFDLR